MNCCNNVVLYRVKHWVIQLFRLFGGENLQMDIKDTVNLREKTSTICQKLTMFFTMLYLNCLLL